jgi:uncharacterized membrane protein YfcA
MKGFWWKLPVLRGLSPVRRGFVQIFAALGFSTTICWPFLYWAHPKIPAETFDAVAQIGATLLIAYAVETSWWLKASRRRSGDRENWVGYASGIGLGGFMGVVVSLALSTNPLDLSWFESYWMTWAFFTLLLLGGLVATLPLLIYEWTHNLQAEYPDE